MLLALSMITLFQIMQSTFSARTCQFIDLLHWTQLFLHSFSMILGIGFLWVRIKQFDFALGTQCFRSILSRMGSYIRLVPLRLFLKLKL